MEECLRLIDESMEHVWLSDYFSAIKQETLLMILQRETLAADEQTIYCSVEKWAVNACNKRSPESSASNRRKMLGPALYLVRFPLLINEQLMAGPAKTGLLLESELWDIFRYKHDAVKPQILFLAEPRKIRVIYYTAPDARVLPGTIYSDPITIGKLRWKMLVKKNDRESAFLGFYLRCADYPKSTPWTCRAEAELCLLPWKTGTAAIKKKISHLYTKEHHGWGFPEYISMEELLDPSKGYVNPTDFSLKLQIHVAAEPPTGIE
ncbi:uncharacterized protein LOC129583396 [Paramacrobiotus metropolitanus]|uniref:uncharacterized protein LOC129583396 n=1 Tax=Paramacrobiotus metropolitanus TaxID=2943436 RepID=UPI00244612C6|nr:uncharacterized protein LOC129583396 [Paramacrobiotus metropolitanus]XP_055331158.1 uncharacterized protein LOC129583396 [Paramacrobiotus metropolitanus]